MSPSTPEPLVAVITPTYNRARLLPAAVDSVLAQTTAARIELAVVDDGSTDDTAQVLRPYLQRHGDPQAKVHITCRRLAKQGVVAARNIGIAGTRAPCIAFLDSDDYWHPRKLECQLAALDADAGIGVVHTSFRYVDELGRCQDDGPQRLANPCVGSCLDPLLDEFLLVFSSVMIRRCVVERAASAEPHGLPFDPRWTNAQDYDLALRAARLCRFAYIAEPLTYYRLHGAHGAMGDLRRAYGFHCRVQLDFVRRYGAEIGIDEAQIRRRVRRFLHGRAESSFWRRDLGVARDLCDLAAELGVDDHSFADLARRASRPRWLYRLKDGLDRLRGAAHA